MQPWRRKKGLMRAPRFFTVFDPMEREVIGDLTAAVSEALIQRAQSAPKDELAEMMDMPSGHTDAPTDPSLARLLPDFERAGDEEFDGDNALLRSLHETDIIKAKLANLQVINEALGPTGGVSVTIEAHEAEQFIAALNDIRLYVASAEAPTEAAEQDRDNLVEFLAYCQDSLLNELMEE